MGCSLASSLVGLKKEIKRHINPEYLFVEPSEMVVTQELHNVAAQGLRDIRYEIGPFITLLDGPLFDFHWQERRTLLLGQISGADLIALSRADLVKGEEKERVFEIFKEYGQTPLLLSSQKGTGLKEVTQAITNT